MTKNGYSKEVLLTGWLWMTCENLSNQILANSKSPLSFWLERRKFPPLQYLLENVGLGRRELFKNSCQFQRKCYLISASCCAALFFTEYLPEYKTRTQLVEVEMGEGKVNFNCFCYAREYVVLWKNLHRWQKLYTAAGSDKYDEFLGNVLPRSECGALADCSLISLSFVCRLNVNYIMYVHSCSISSRTVNTSPLIEGFSRGSKAFEKHPVQFFHRYQSSEVLGPGVQG